MSARAARWLAWSVGGVTLALCGLGLVLLMLNGATPVPDSWGVRGVSVPFALVYGATGVLVALRRPENAVGWLLATSGVFYGALIFCAEYAAYASLARPGALPAPELVAWLLDWMWIPVAVLVGVFLPLLFPDGRLPSPRWRAVPWLAAVGAALAILGEGFEPGPLQNASYLTNPVTISGAGDALRGVGSAGMALVAASALAASASVFLRLRRSTGMERQQLKWLASAAVLFGVALLTPSLPLGAPKAVELFVTVTFLGFPVAVAVAVLRYRLYHIDLLINRTLVYGALTALLGLTYWGSVLLLQRLLSPLTAGSDLAIVGSTLAVAALFQPARKRVQAQVDRRFYRARYDAQRTLEHFGTRLRDRVDLEGVSAELLVVVRQTVQPTHAFVWLRPSTPRRAQPD